MNKAVVVFKEIAAVSQIDESGVAAVCLSAGIAVLPGEVAVRGSAEVVPAEALVGDSVVEPEVTEGPVPATVGADAAAWVPAGVGTDAAASVPPGVMADSAAPVSVNSATTVPARVSDGAGVESSTSGGSYAAPNYSRSQEEESTRRTFEPQNAVLKPSDRLRGTGNAAHTLQRD
ncbi:hypothetical protein NHX12_023945 [Muraenolepis orangiensis]|uniref:Uncharacterized protein n=1 Tax=Muraenolepis orangiensis TaxID=630683 RepID=A0A9Q0ELI1_9TELE|nr:hypothetical protein NHX12_023945 [Muraenolepis orangiensis]